MLYGYIIFVVLKRKCTIPIISFWLKFLSDLIAVEVVNLLAAFSVFVGPVAHLPQRFVAVGIGVDIGISVVRVDFLQEVAADPNESGYLFKAV